MEKLWTFLVNFFIILQISLIYTLDITPDPKFTAAILNVTIPVGREAVLLCKVYDLVSYKVAWLRVDTQTILTIQNHVITKNSRISISHTEHRIWELRIKNVRESDRGWYMCQINTDPMKSQVGYLDVVVAPDIVDKETSHDIVIDEGLNATLVCTATGLPNPTITWRRENQKALISTSSGKEIFSVEGPNLYLRNVHRHHMGAYLCIAHNGVPPTVSKRILLVVNFAPTIWTPYETILAHIGQKIILECITESHPTSINYWLKDKEFIQGGTYESVTLENVFRIVMRLSIRPVKGKDFGDYKCIAKNVLGESVKIITILHKSKKDILINPHISLTGNNLAIFQNDILSTSSRNILNYWLFQLSILYITCNIIFKS